MAADGTPSQPYVDALNRKNQNGLKGMPKLVFLGDSLTQFWENNDNLSVFNEKFSGYSAERFGYAGDQTQHLLWRIENGVLDRIRPKVAVVLIGSNNTTDGYSVDEIVAGNQAVIDLIRKKSPDTKILLLGLFPRFQNMKYGDGNTTIEKVNKKLATLADGKKVFYMDIGLLLLNKQGFVTTDIFYDYTHLSKKGYTIYADAILPMLKKLM